MPVTVFKIVEMFSTKSIDTGHYPIISCLFSVCFDDAMHGRFASFYVNTGIRVNSSGGGRRMMLCVGFTRKWFLLPYPKLCTCQNNPKNVPYIT